MVCGVLLTQRRGLFLLLHIFWVCSASAFTHLRWVFFRFSGLRSLRDPNRESWIGFVMDGGGRGGTGYAAQGMWVCGGEGDKHNGGV